MDAQGLQRALVRMATQAREMGVHLQETLVATDGSAVVTFLKAGDASQVIQLHKLAGLPEPRVHEAHRVHTDLLSLPHRAR